MGQVNLRGASSADYSEWKKTPAGRQNSANFFAKYPSASMLSMVPQPPENWQQQLADHRKQQSGPPVIGNAPNGRPVTGAYGQQPAAPKGDFEAYRPSQAQPKTTSQGTPYGIPAADGGNPYFIRQQPAAAPPVNTQFTTGWNDAMAPYANTPGMSFTPATTYGGEGAGNMAYADPRSRPSPFDTSIRGFGGEQMQPDRFYAQRDALIQRLNSESGARASQAGVYYGNEVPNFYRPQRDMNTLWGQAGDDISGGWNNPFTGMGYTPPVSKADMGSPYIANQTMFYAPDDPPPPQTPVSRPTLRPQSPRNDWYATKRAKAQDAAGNQREYEQHQATLLSPLFTPPPRQPDPTVMW